ncbi:high mobility group protein B2b [Alosa sapidissima]|nr:high mobility group protein B2b [Alosa sapidissima]
MVKGDVNKPKGKTSAYAYFVQTCRDEHKRKTPDVPVNFAAFSKKCSERWRSLTAPDKIRFEDMAKADKVRYDREMTTYVPPKGMGKRGKKKKDPNAPKRPPSAFFIFCSDHRSNIKGENPSLTIGEIAKKLGELWSKQSAKDRAPYDQKAAKLKEKYEKEIAAYRAKTGMGGGAKRGPGRPQPAAMAGRQAEPQDDDDEDEDDEDDDDEDDDEDDE